LVTKDSETPDDIAHAALVNGDFKNVLCGYHLAQIRPNRESLLGEYLCRLFYVRKFNDQFVVAAHGVTRFGLSAYSFRNAYIPLPSVTEQEQITDFLRKETNQIDSTISKHKESIEFLREYRTALISEVVTGKVDIRDKVVR
jgi:type I restriction enzyme S subunit